VKPHRRKSFDPTDSVSLSKVLLNMIVQYVIDKMYCSRHGFIQALLLTPVLEKKIQFL
jgi:hypothetical protein